jgi:membrane associated rhomboid family serine protease
MFQSSKTVKQLFYANVAIFVIGILAEFLGFPFYQTFSLYPQKGFMPHQLITHQFLHGGVLHILFNMFALISIGPSVEDYLGRVKFLVYYLLCGLGGAFLHMALVNSSTPMVGASGAIYGIVLMFTLLYPNEKLYFFGLIGMKSKYLISLMFAYEIYAGFFATGDGISHMAHIGGGLTGILLLLIDKYIITPRKKTRRWT